MLQQWVILAACLMVSIGVAGAVTPPMPTFFARRDYTGLYANQVAVADTNGDGIPDLIANQDGYIEVLFGNGDGTFSPGPSTHTGLLTAVNFVAMDLNGDGKIDLAIAGGPNDGQQPEGLAVCLGNGDGTFQTAVFYPAGTDYAIGSVVVGNFDGDGTADAMVSGESGVWLFTGKGNGEFNAGVLAISLAQRYGGGLAAADFNEDNKLDLVVTLPASGGGFEVFLGHGNGTFQTPQTFAEPATPVGLALGALTKGGHPSIAVSQYASESVYLYLGNGAGHFSAPQQIDLPGTTGTGGLAIGNLTNDGYPDLVSSGGCIAFGTATGASKPVCYPVSDVEGTYNVVLGDLRKNGQIDIVTDSHNGVSVLLSMDRGKYEDGKWTAVTGGADCGVTADFNGDGKPDLAVNTPSGISILLGTGNPKSPFTPGSTIPLSGAGCLVTGDLNRDGIPDLLIPIRGNPDALLAYLNNGDGTFTLTSSTPTPNSGGYVVLADFNRDGVLDFATSGNLLALGNGDGTFQMPQPIVSSVPPGTFSNIATGDINNDGWPDLVLTSEADVNLYVLLNNQQGGFTQVPATFGETAIQALLADLNGDGNLDLVLRYFGGGASIYLGNGLGAFTYQVGLDDPEPASGFNMVADVNGDGIPDIEVSGADTVAVFLGTGGAEYATPFDIGTGPSPGSLLVANLHGQAVSAGLPDVVVPDTSGGVMVLINQTR